MTGAGQALADRLAQYYPPDEYASWRDWVAAIEAEERERLRAEVRESGRVGVVIHANASRETRSAYTEGFHHGIREALTQMADPEPGFPSGDTDDLRGRQPETY